jgi:hypothetical protein
MADEHLFQFDSFPATGTPEERLNRISETRETDIVKLNEFQNNLIRGRLITRTPSGSADVVATDAVGDINFTATYMYVLVDNGGTHVWRRVALSSF